VLALYYFDSLKKSPHWPQWGSRRLPTIHDTAYPRLKSSVSEKEPNEIYTPTADEFDLAHSLTNSTAMRIGFLVLLKTFQRLGYFIPARKAPHLIYQNCKICLTL
jgi:hypothetical protein